MQTEQNASVCCLQHLGEGVEQTLNTQTVRLPWKNPCIHITYWSWLVSKLEGLVENHLAMWVRLDWPPRWLRLLFKMKAPVDWHFTQRHYSHTCKVKEGNSKHYKPQLQSLGMWDKWVNSSLLDVTLVCAETRSNTSWLKACKHQSSCSLHPCLSGLVVHRIS